MAFNERATTSHEVPLFWLKVGGVIPGPTVPSRELVESKYAKDGPVLIASLRFDSQGRSSREVSGKRNPGR
jgi:hypothetical protein